MTIPGPPQWSDVQKVLHWIAIFATNIDTKKQEAQGRTISLLPYDVTWTT
jgi:hypothetical protein